MGIIRLILALAVVVAHSTPIFGLDFGAKVAVPCFFVISGFYMALILSEKYVGSHSSYWLFISNRLLRLYPVYFFVLFCTLAANIYAFKHGGSPKISLFLSLIKEGKFPVSGLVLYIFSSLTLFFQDLIPQVGFDKGSLYFITGHVLDNQRLNYFNLVPQSWSLGSEVLFYSLAPFIVKRSNVILILLITAGIAFRIYFSIHYGQDMVFQNLFPSVLPFFILGIFSYRLYRSAIFQQNAERCKNKLIWSLPVFILILITNQLVEHSSSINFFYPIILTCFIPLVFYNYRTNTFDKHVAELSYPIYISHLFVSMLLKVLLPYYFYHNGLVLSVLTVAFSFFIINLIVNPIEKIRQKRVFSS